MRLRIAATCAAGIISRLKRCVTIQEVITAPISRKIGISGGFNAPSGPSDTRPGHKYPQTVAHSISCHIYQENKIKFSINYTIKSAYRIIQKKSLKLSILSYIKERVTVFATITKSSLKDTKPIKTTQSTHIIPRDHRNHHTDKRSIPISRHILLSPEDLAVLID
ncbi:MAG: hypothetical protein OXC46_03140 [Thaumarchaeota archaeon]|nr:hypothetical protein [Nitrososphaerota archaeon]